MIKIRITMMMIRAMLLLGTGCLWTAAVSAEPLVLASAETARVTIVTASTNHLALARDLAGYLKRMSGASFEVRIAPEPPDTPAILLGTARDYPALQMEKLLPLYIPEDREHYIVRSSGSRLLLIGTTDLATEHAAYRLLDALGCRWFFPGSTWECIPARPDLVADLALDERPHYLTRKFLGGTGTWGSKVPVTEAWRQHNRVANSLSISPGDGAYGRFIAKNKALFETHPEYYALVNGQRTPRGNFCVSNPNLRAAFTEDILAQFRKKPDLESLSVEPDDTPVWCECDTCKKLGTPSDRVVTLANQVAAAVAREFPNKNVGMYAYSAHVAPPHIRLHPNVYVAVATSFIHQPHDEILEGWRKQGANLGVREYSSVYIWDFALPWRGGRAGNLTYLRSTIPHWYNDFGIRVFTTETVANWGLFGLGNYVTGKLLWDVNTDVDAVVNDFLTRCFGRAAAPMRTFYAMLDGGSKPEPSDDYLGRLYRCIQQARDLEDDPAVRARLNDLVLYLRYIDCFTAYENARNYPRKGVDKATCAQDEFEAMLRFTWKIRATGMVETYSNWRWLQRFGGFAWPGGKPVREAALAVTAAKREGHPLDKKAQEALTGLSWMAPEGQHPWKEPGTFFQEDIDAMLARGIAMHPLLDANLQSFSEDLVPAGLPSGLAIPSQRPATRDGSSNTVGFTTRNNVCLYLWAEHGRPLPTLTLTSGLVYTNSGLLDWTLYDAKDAKVDAGQIDSNGEPHPVRFKDVPPGLYRFAVEDRGRGTAYAWPTDARISISASTRFPAKFNNALGPAQRLYFYVPKTTEKIVVYRTAGMNPWTFCDPAGKAVLTSEAFDGHTVVPVPPEQRGKVWSVLGAHGRNIKFLTTPPTVAFSPEGLLVPKELAGEARAASATAQRMDIDKK